VWSVVAGDSISTGGDVASYSHSNVTPSSSSSSLSGLRNAVKQLSAVESEESNFSSASPSAEHWPTADAVLASAPYAALRRRLNESIALSALDAVTLSDLRIRCDDSIAAHLTTQQELSSQLPQQQHNATAATHAAWTAVTASPASSAPLLQTGARDVNSKLTRRDMGASTQAAHLSRRSILDSSFVALWLPLLLSSCKPDAIRCPT
jgi:hypothetical protein